MMSPLRVLVIALWLAATTVVAAESPSDDDDPVPGWALVAMPLAAFGVAIVSRRRWVVTQRALRAADPQ